jgi:hypothetical protein
MLFVGEPVGVGRLAEASATLPQKIGNPLLF